MVDGDICDVDPGEAMIFISSCGQSRRRLFLLGLYKESKIAGYPTNKWIGSGREAGQHVVGREIQYAKLVTSVMGKMDGWMDWGVFVWRREAGRNI